MVRAVECRSDKTVHSSAYADIANFSLTLCLRDTSHEDSGFRYDESAGFDPQFHLWRICFYAPQCNIQLFQVQWSVTRSLRNTQAAADVCIPNLWKELS